MSKRSKSGRPDKARRPDTYWKAAAEGFGRDALGFIEIGEEEYAYWSTRFAIRCAMFIQVEQRTGDETI